MIKVIVKDGNIEKALKTFKRKYDRIGVGRELRRRQQYEKPSVTKRDRIQKAIYVQSLHRDDD